MGEVIELCRCGDCKRCKGRAAVARYRERHRDRLRAESRAEYARLREDPEYRAKHNLDRKQRRWNHPNVLRVLEVRSAPCVDCGMSLPPEVMDLDHVRGEKRFSFSQAEVARPAITPEILEEEIAKCEVRCPNCHRLRHHLERQEAA
jgi:hypothetical protein